MNLQESFDTLVSKLEKQGKSEHYAKAIAGKVAKEKGDMPYQKKETKEGEDCPYTKLGKLAERVLDESGSETTSGARASTASAARCGTKTPTILTRMTK